jgi:hypothetical protein
VKIVICNRVRHLWPTGERSLNRRPTPPQLELLRFPLTAGGAHLSFGTEGSVGPVFFADDPHAVVLGRLRDGGDPAFTLREHGSWRSVYLAMLNFGAQLLRNLAKDAGVHVWTDSDDVVYVNRSMLCLHTASAGTKRIALPARAVVTDLWTGQRYSQPLKQIERESAAYRTHAWHLQYLDNPLSMGQANE